MRQRSLLLSFALAPLLSQGATTYYVSVGGSDSQSGSLAKPFRTIQHACNVAANGDSVLVTAGTYSEKVVLKSSITLANASGTRPILNGAGLPVDANNGLIYIDNLSNVMVQGFEIENYKTTNSQLVPTGIFIEGTGNNITLRNNLIHNIENDGSDASSINGFGIAVYGDSAEGKITNLTIEGNEIHDTKTGSSETLTVNGNVEGFRILNNYVHNVNNIGIDAIGFEGTSPIAGQDQARSGLIQGNVVDYVTSGTNPAYAGSLGADGIYVDGGTNIVIQGNVVHHADLGIEVASEHLGRLSSYVTVRNNLLYANNLVGLSIGGYDDTRGGTSNCFLVNNTLVGNDTTNSGSGEFQIQFHTSENVFKNNLLSASSQGILISGVTGAGSTVGLVSDDNLYNTLGIPSWQWNGVTYGSLTSFVTGSKGDTHSLFAPPQFVSPAMKNYQVLSGSPAIGHGINLGASIVGTVDITGRPRVQDGRIDIGCFESVPLTP